MLTRIKSTQHRNRLRCFELIVLLFIVTGTNSSAIAETPSATKQGLIRAFGVLAISLKKSPIISIFLGMLFSIALSFFIESLCDEN